MSDLHYAVETALARSKSKKPTSEVGYCLREVRECLGVPAKAADAIQAWQQASYHHRITAPTQKKLAKIPDGAPIFWAGGSAGHGHIAINASSLGAGLCLSTDIKRPGYFDVFPILQLPKVWRGFKFLGWTEDLNGIRLITAGVE